MAGFEAQAKDDIIWGLAKTEQGKIAYYERHEVSYVSGTLKGAKTTYLGPTRTQTIAVMTSDFTRSISFPEYTFENKQTGYREGLRFSSGVYQAYFQDPAKKEKSAVIKPSTYLFAGQGWNYYFLENLQLIQKQGMAFELLFPGKLDSYPLKLEDHKTKGPILTTTMLLDHWLFQYFAPEMQLTYHLKEKRLLRYQGISNIEDADGDQQKVDIQYYFDGKLPP